MKKRSMFILLVFLYSVNSLAQFDFSLSVRGGANYSDMNFGYEFIGPIIAPLSTQGYAAGGESGVGYYLGIGTSIETSSNISFFLNADYSVMNYLVEGQAFDGSNPPPVDPQRIIEVDGNVNYSFASLETGLSYAFGKSAPNGFRTNVFLNHLIHLNTDRNVTLTYGDESKGDESDLNIEDPDYNNLWLVGLGVGYQFQINESLALVPSADIRFGLNSIVGDEPAPSVIQFGLALNKRF